MTGPIHVNLRITRRSTYTVDPNTDPILCTPYNLDSEMMSTDYTSAGVYDAVVTNPSLSGATTSDLMVAGIL
jgi:hypothetical protein